MLLFQLLRDGGQVGIRDLQRNAGLKPCDDLEMMISVVGQLCRCKLHGSPKLGIAVGKLETARHHADHIVLYVVEPELLADDLRIAAKPAQKESLAQDHHARRSRHIVGGAEIATERGASAENGKKIRGDEIPGNLFGVSFAGEVE